MGTGKISWVKRLFEPKITEVEKEFKISKFASVICKVSKKKFGLLGKVANIFRKK